MADYVLTVGDLIDRLRAISPDSPIYLPGGLTFMGLTGDCDTGYIMEVEEPLADFTPEFFDRNPHVQAVFIKASLMKPGELVSGPHDISVY